MPMPKTVCGTHVYNKLMQLEVCRTFLGRGMGMNITAQLHLLLCSSPEGGGARGTPNSRLVQIPEMFRQCFTDFERRCSAQTMRRLLRHSLRRCVHVLCWTVKVFTRICRCFSSGVFTEVCLSEIRTGRPLCESMTCVYEALFFSDSCLLRNMIWLSSG